MSQQTVSIESAVRWKEKLLASDKYYFKTLQPSILAEDMAVVYVIFDKSTDEALYVGRTKKLRRRLYTNHLQGNKSTARLKKYIVEDNQNFPEINDTVMQIQTPNLRKKWPVQASVSEICLPAKGVPEDFDIFFTASRHVETVVLMSRVNK